ncbi:MAG TPA: M50 family metallopeptidase [Terriglobales bacterium]
MPTRQGSVRLFSYSGITVFLHWSWFLVAVYEINARRGGYSSVGWNVAEYLAIFLVVMLHEFGHALACRQVGGTANQIVLWPFGGVAYVNPPPRPGATLWSIAAGPLVNVALLPVIFAIGMYGRSAGWAQTAPDARAFVHAVWVINLILLTFNILPIYPLDGGQILRSVLWFIFGRARSLWVATILGFIGIPLFLLFAWLQQSMWLGILAVFLLLNCWGGLQQARALSKIAKLPRREGYACPQCKSAPPLGDYWKCARCGQAFDTFATGAVCPNCRVRFNVTRCLDCGGERPIGEWAGSNLVSANSEAGFLTRS